MYRRPQLLSFTMAAALPADVKSILEGTARYEVESLPRLEEVARAQLKVRFQLTSA